MGWFPSNDLHSVSQCSGRVMTRPYNGIPYLPHKLQFIVFLSKKWQRGALPFFRYYQPITVTSPLTTDLNASTMDSVDTWSAKLELTMKKITVSPA